MSEKKARVNVKRVMKVGGETLETLGGDAAVEVLRAANGLLTVSVASGKDTDIVFDGKLVLTAEAGDSLVVKEQGCIVSDKGGILNTEQSRYIKELGEFLLQGAKTPTTEMTRLQIARDIANAVRVQCQTL